MKALDLLGLTFGRLEVVGRDATSGRVHWLCRCQCGNETRLQTYLLRSGKIKSCGCASKDKPEPGVGGFNKLLRSYKRGAKKRGLTFNLTPEQFYKLTSSDCSYCGLPPHRISSYSRWGASRTAYFYTGIDRIDVGRGYEPDNCVPCCRTCNFFRQSLPVEEFLEHALRIASHQLRKETV